MTKLIALIAAGSFATTALFAGEHGEGIRNVQNERKEMKMACSIPLDDLNLTPEHGDPNVTGSGAAVLHQSNCNSGQRPLKHPLPTDVDAPAVLKLRAVKRLNNW